MRSRNIKPGFFENEILGSIDPLAQILFAGLWCLSDREGRLEDRPARIKAQIFPYRQANIDKLLALLAQSGFIIRYEIEGQKFICIPKFKEHQKPHPHEAKSKLPDISMSLHVMACDTNVSKCNADIRIEDIMNEDSNIPPVVPPNGGGAFDRFWESYPRKVGKDKAEESWNKRKLDPLLGTILSSLEIQKKSSQWTKDGGQFIPHPSTWLNQGRWKDDPEVKIEEAEYVPKFVY